MVTYSAIKWRISEGAVTLPPLSVPSFQVWMGGTMDPLILDLALLQRKACSFYTLIAPEGSEVAEALMPDVLVNADAYLEDVLLKHPQARNYLTRWNNPVDKSEVVRFAYLAENANQVYLDMDVLLLKEPKRFHMPQYAFATAREEADIFVIYGGGDTVLFDTCLRALSPENGRSALRTMVRNLPHRIPEDSYFHYSRGLRA